MNPFSLTNPWVILALILAFGGVATGGYVKGRADKGASVLAQEVRDRKLVDTVKGAVGDWLATYEGKTTVIRQKAIETVRTNTIYTECKLPEDMQELIRQAREAK